MSNDKPLILVVDNLPSSRSYLNREFSRADWFVREWDPKGESLDSLEQLPCEGLAAAVADWHLGDSPFNGLEVLSRIRKRNDRAACVLYTAWATEDEWSRVREEAGKSEILALAPRTEKPILYKRVIAEARRLRPGFQEPRQAWEDYEAWIRPYPDPPDLRLEQAIDSVGRSNLVPIIRNLFPERGPQRPIRYTFLSSGFSGARVFLLKDQPGTPNLGPRYIVKVAQGDGGVSALREELARFQSLILGSAPGQQKMAGYVTTEVRPTGYRSEPADANDWFGIAYREVGNGMGRVTSFQQLYLERPESDPLVVQQEDSRAWDEKRSRRLAMFLRRLYSDCLGHWYQRGAKAANRKLWAAGPPPEDSKAAAFYYLEPKKKLEIFLALDELRPRAGILLERLCGPKAGDIFIDRIRDFIQEGRCQRELSEATLFHHTFRLLEAGTHRDLHAGNVLAVEQGEFDPFIIDFSEFEEKGHPFYDYVRLENDIRLRLMSYEDGSDILDGTVANWLYREERLKMVYDDQQNNELQISPGSAGFVDKAYMLMTEIRALAYRNLVLRLDDQNIKPTKEEFSGQYTAALLHRTLTSLASTDIIPQKKILGVWLAASLISRLGTLVSKMTA